MLEPTARTIRKRLDGALGRALDRVRRLPSSGPRSALRRPSRVALAVALVVLVTTSIALRRTEAGALAALALAGVLGAGVARYHETLSRAIRAVIRLPGQELFVVAMIVLAGVTVFWHTLDPATGGALYGDWAPHHVNVAFLVDALERGHWPTWNQIASSGDAPLETYPAPAYTVAALITIALDAREHIPLVLAYLGVGCQIGISLGVARLALRLVPSPLALAAGLVTLIDSGDYGGGAGGVRAMVHWGVFHQGLSQVWSLVACAAIADTLARGPRIGRSVCVWTFTALATAFHPNALFVVIAALPALGVSALVGRDAAPHRALVACVDLGLGAMLGAVVWMPLGERTLQYGLHYANASTPMWQAFGAFARAELPAASLPVVVAASYAGVVVALLSRRAVPAFVAVTGTLLLLASVDLPFLVSGATPSAWFARFAAYRLPGLAKPFLFAIAPLGVLSLVRAAAAPLSLGPVRSRLALGAVLGIALVFFGRGAAPYLDRESRDASMELPNIEVIPDPAGLTALIDWARTTAREQTPDRFGRLLFARSEFYMYQLTARSGLPSLWVGGMVPGMQLRERIEDTSAESLRRFGIRWVVDRDRSPMLGDAATELRLGTYRIRELREWDGKLARVESGGGDAVVTRHEGDRIAFELRGTDSPALVVLGVPYYPRWRAWHGARRIPVYARMATERARSRVLALWAPPGRTVLTCDGPLPSDTRGRPLTWLALTAALAIILASTWSRARRIARRAWARGARAFRRRRAAIIATAALGVSAALLAWGATQSGAVARAVTLHTGTVGNGRVEVKAPGERRRHCPYSAWQGGFVCPYRGLVTGTVGGLINDYAAAWPYNAPSIKIWPDYTDVEFRVHMRRRLAGSYWIAFGGRNATGRLEVGDRRLPLFGGTQRLDLPITPEDYDILFEVQTRGREVAGVSFVRADALDIDRTRDVPWAPARPPSDL